MAYYIVGLGNPGPEYLFTRHNIGFMLLDLMQQQNSFTFKKSCGGIALEASCQIAGKEVSFIKPLTFMNKSGLVLKRLNLERNDDGEILNLLVIFDDIYIPFGTIRYRPHGNDGGHNGMKSIIQCIATNKFHRLRIGVGVDKPIDDLYAFVLGNFSHSEREFLSDILIESARSVEWYLENGIQNAMNKFNGKVI